MLVSQPYNLNQMHTSLPYTTRNLDIFIATIPHLVDIFTLLDHDILVFYIFSSPQSTICTYVTNYFFYMQGYDNTKLCGYLAAVKWWDQPDSDNIY